MYKAKTEYSNNVMAQVESIKKEFHYFSSNSHVFPP